MSNLQKATINLNNEKKESTQDLANSEPTPRIAKCLPDFQQSPRDSQEEDQLLTLKLSSLLTTKLMLTSLQLRKM